MVQGVHVEDIKVSVSRIEEEETLSGPGVEIFQKGTKSRPTPLGHRTPAFDAAQLGNLGDFGEAFNGLEIDPRLWLDRHGVAIQHQASDHHVPGLWVERWRIAMAV